MASLTLNSKASTMRLFVTFSGSAVLRFDTFVDVDCAEATAGLASAAAATPAAAPTCPMNERRLVPFDLGAFGGVSSSFAEFTRMDFSLMYVLPSAGFADS